MKILHLDDETWDSGLTEYALSLARAQQKAGADCLFGAPRGSHAFSAAEKAGLPVLDISRKWAKAGQILAETGRFGPQVINAHTGSAHTFGAFLKFLSSGPRAKLVRTRADARPFSCKPLSAPLWALTDGFIGANSAINRSFRICLPNGPQDRLILQGIADFCSEGAPAPQGKTLGILSRLDPVKGHSTAIKALRIIRERFPETKLRIAGQEQNVKGAELKQLAQDMGLSDSVSIEGFVPDKKAFLLGCDIGLVPSLGSEAVSRAALEWMCAGKPVLASSVGGLGDIVKNGETGFLLEPGSASAIADAACTLLDQPDKLRTMAQAGRKRYEQFFSLEKFTAETYDFYNSLLTSSKSDGGI